MTGGYILNPFVMTIVLLNCWPRVQKQAPLKMDDNAMPCQNDGTEYMAFESVSGLTRSGQTSLANASMQEKARALLAVSLLMTEVAGGGGPPGLAT